jgi:hypothetical protein
VTVHFIRSAEIDVALPPDAAMRLFTPEGERLWAGRHGWNPWYPDPSRRAGPGFVFSTGHQGATTIWVMVDHSPDRVRYVRVTPDGLAGTVEVRALSASGPETRLRVTYDLTALSGHAVAELARFAAGYDAEIATWAEDIAESVKRSRASHPNVDDVETSHRCHEPFLAT